MVTFEDEEGYDIKMYIVLIHVTMFIKRFIKINIFINFFIIFILMHFTNNYRYTRQFGRN